MKKCLWDGLLGYIKVDKKNKNTQNNCLLKILKAWGVKYLDRFVKFYYPHYSKIFFKKVIRVVKLVSNMLHYIIAIKKLNNITIN